MRSMRNKVLKDTRFKFLTIVAACVIVSLATLWIFASQNESGKDVKCADSDGKYFYVDMTGLIHASRNCSRLNYKGMKNNRIEALRIDIGSASEFCPKCVSDEVYERMMAITQDRHMVAKKKLIEVYEWMKSENFDVPNEYDTFKRTLTADGEEGYDNRLALYKTLKEYNSIDSPTFEIFSSRLFAPAEE